MMNVRGRGKQIGHAHFLSIAALSTMVLFSAEFAMALEPIPEKSGFSGFVRPGIGYMRFKSNLVASFLGFDLSKRKTDSLIDTPDSESTPIALLPFSVEYTFASTRTQLFLGTELTDLIRFDFAQQAGVKQGIGKAGILQAGVLFSGIPAKVWRDPYVVNQDRDDTQRKSNGARLVWDRIGGSQLELRYTYRNIDINNERSGEFLEARGDLTSDQRRLLRRDGDRHEVRALYRFRFADKHTLTPALIYTKADLDGGARKNDAYDFELTYGYKGDPITLVANGFIGSADYDKQNPIYGRTQNDDRYGLGATLFYKNPWGTRLFGSQPMRFYGTLAYVNIDANINFYDEQVIFGTVGVFFKW